MDLDANGNIQFNGIKLSMGMEYDKFYEVLPGFKGSEYKTSLGALIGHVGFLDNETSGPDWEIAVQVFVEKGLSAVHLRHVGSGFTTEWMGNEREFARKEQHINFLNEFGIKQKRYDFGYVRCSMNKSQKVNMINIII
jgi:hypothetical protein